MGKDINNDNSFMVRLRSSVILMIVAIGSMLLGGWVLYGVLVLITMIGLMELYRVVGVNKAAAGFAGYLAAAVWYLYVALSQYGKAGILNFQLIVAGFMVIILAVYVLTFPKFKSEQITMTVFGFFYVAVTLSYIYSVRMQDCGAYTVWLIFIGSWGSDTMAYVVGRKLGKTKIAPKLSPKKSLEGLIGGILGAALIGFVYALIFRTQLEARFANPCLVFAIVGGVGSVISQIGDMAASAIKRDKGIKDYGTLIPGHGGILDRFDSVIFIAPIVYYLLTFMN